MYERFDDGARRVVIAADAAAHTLGDHMVSTTHLLLGLLAEDTCTAMLSEAGAPVDRLRELLQATGEGRTPPARIPFTTDARIALERSLREALATASNRIGPVHLLLAVLLTDERTTREVLDAAPVDRAAVRAAILATLVPDVEPVRYEPLRSPRITFRLDPEGTTVDVSEMMLQLASQLRRLEDHVDRLTTVVERLERRDL